MNKDAQFSISEEELMILSSCTIPPTPIARAVFWRNMIEKYYHEMTKDERRKIHEWLNRNWIYEEGLEKKNEDVLWFEKRYNPENQYLIHTLYEGKEETHECFKNGDRYWTSTTRFIAPEFITKVEKL
jgi:hypothetical protein